MLAGDEALATAAKDEVRVKLTPMRLVVYLVCGAIAAILLWSEATNTSPFQDLLWDWIPLRNAMVLVFLPAALVGHIVEGNIHNRNEPATYAAAFVQGIGMAVIADLLLFVWRNRRKMKRDEAP